MCNAWKYYGLKPLRSGRPGRQAKFLNHLLSQLYKWTRAVVKTYQEFPVGYTEWTLTAHMNIVANLCGWLPYSEYTVKLVKGRRSSPAGTARPDLYVYGKDGQHEHCWNFELKRGFITLGASRQDLEHRVAEKMRANYLQLRKLAKGKYDWSDYGCCALGFTIWMDAIVRAGKRKELEDRWQKKWHDCQEYDNDCLTLWQELKTALRNKSDELDKFGRVYYSGYIMQHSLARTFYEDGQKNVREGEWEEARIPVGMLWVLAYKSLEDIAKS